MKLRLVAYQLVTSLLTWKGYGHTVEKQSYMSVKEKTKSSFGVDHHVESGKQGSQKDKLVASIAKQ